MRQRLLETNILPLCLTSERAAIRVVLLYCPCDVTPRKKPLEANKIISRRLAIVVSQRLVCPPDFGPSSVSFRDMPAHYLHTALDVHPNACTLLTSTPYSIQADATWRGSPLAASSWREKGAHHTTPHSTVLEGSLSVDGQVRR